MRLSMARALIKLVKEASSAPYLLTTLFCPKADPRAPGRTFSSDLINCQPLFSSKFENVILPSFANTLIRLDVIPKSLAAAFAEIICF